MRSIPHPLEANQPRPDHSKRELLEIERLLAPHQLRTSRTAPDEIDAMNEELRRVAREQKPIP